MDGHCNILSFDLYFLLFFLARLKQYSYLNTVLCKYVKLFSLCTQTLSYNGSDTKFDMNESSKCECKCKTSVITLDALLLHYYIHQQSQCSQKIIS